MNVVGSELKEFDEDYFLPAFILGTKYCIVYHQSVSPLFPETHPTSLHLLKDLPL